jgi:hypothetical protein
MNVLSPVYIVKTGNRLGIVWSWGFTAHEKVLVDIYPFICADFLILWVVIPLAFLAGLATDVHRFTLTTAVEFFVWTAPVFFGAWLGLAVIYMGGGVFSLATTPVLYVNTPLIVIILALIARHAFHGRKASTKEQ